MQELFTKIEKSSEYRFFYNNDEVDINQRISVDAEDKTIGTILETALKGLPYSFKETENKLIVIERTGEITNPSGTNVQQGKKVTGKVTDPSGVAIPGASVVLKGTTIGVTTDTDGNFSLTLPADAKSLVFSFVGLLTQEIVVGNKTTFNITLTEETIGLEQVIAIGYGTQRKRDVTGSVSSISSKDIFASNISNATQVLQGKVAGVMVLADNGSPGSGVSVRIRGTGTVNNNDPLYVIDGMPSSSMSNLNPMDIESIEILKDASASAIYGARAANGVVLVSTKKGSTGKTNIHFDSYVGISTARKEPNRLNSDQYYDMIKTASINSNRPIPASLETQYALGYSTNWWDEISQQGMVQNNYISVAGGTEKARYSVSSGYFKEKGLLKRSDFDRISFRINTDFNLSKRVKSGLNLGITSTSRNSIDGLGINGIGIEPFIAVVDPNKDPKNPNYEYEKYMAPGMNDGKNPVGQISRTYDLNKNFEVKGNAYINFNILNGLDFKTNFGMGITNFNSYGFSPKFYLTPRENAPENTVSRGYTNFQNYLWENTITYVKKINQIHDFSFLAGISTESSLNEGFSGSKQSTPENTEYFRILDAATINDKISGSKGSNALLSYFGRINYGYKDKYLLTVNLRRDGSSRFAKDKSWGIFPSVSAGWRLSEEGFFKDLNATFIDYVKLRAGWGQIGNQNIANNAYLSLISGGNSRRYVFGDAVYQGYSPSNVGNPNILWETVEQTNVALDVNLFDKKLTFSADYYIKNTKGMLLKLPLVYYSGYPGDPWDNAGNVQNRGLELELNLRNKISDFNYEIGINFSTLHNEVKSLGLGIPLFGSVSKTEVGYPIGSFYGYVMDGIFQDQAEVAQGAQPKARPGDIRFKDIAGPKDASGKLTGPDGKIDEYDKTHIGTPIPDYLFGLNLSGNYKSFDLAVLLQGVYGNDKYTNFTTTNLNGAFNVEVSEYEGAWRGKGTSNYYPIISVDDLNDNYRTSTFSVQDGSYLRVKNIQLGYTLPTSISEKMKISKIRLYVSCQNLWTFTKYPGLDPETGDTSPLNIGTDYGGSPQPKTIMGGISVDF
ncbi:MAG TPA: TonB-dependent receptor [Prolixibacteraceae bacterium]|nr:TonB-dependent receptor [Prolixibacteraceae bacterium]